MSAALRIRVRWSIERDGREPEDLGYNAITQIGLQNFLDRGFGLGGTAISHLGVGDSNANPGVIFSQTDLQAATNKYRKALDAGYPARASQTVTARATFGNADANFAWNEFGLFWGASGSNMFSRKVQNLGTKSGGTWVLTATVELA